MVLTVLSRIFSNNLPIVSRRFMGRYDEGSAGSYPGFRMEIMRVCFHTAGMCWARRAALNMALSEGTARCGRCFKALFGIPFGSGALLTFRPRMASCTSAESINLGSLAGAKEYTCSASSTISLTAGSDGELSLKTVRQGFSFLRI